MDALKFQLNQVESALKGDPSNTELISLKRDLEELIALSSSSAPTVHGQSSSAPSTDRNPGQTMADRSEVSAGGKSIPPPPPSSADFSVGDSVLARWSGDGRFHPARIEAVTVADGGTVSFVVVFTGYGSSEVVSGSDVEKVNSSDTIERKLAQEKKKKQYQLPKKKKKQTLAEHNQKKEAEQQAKAAAWTSFKTQKSKGGRNRPY